MWEQGLVNLEQRPLVVHEQVEDVLLVFAGEVADFHSILRKLGQTK